MDAINNPVRGRPRKEVHTDDFEIGQRPSILLSGDEPIEHGDEIAAVDISIHKAYLEELAFMEEPVTIMLQATSEKFAPKFVQCFVNGKGAEIFANGKWVAYGWIPVGVAITTKRKYVEVLARSKHDSIQTRHGSTEDENPQQFIDRFTSAKHPLSILQDNSPKSMDWLTKIYAEG